MMTSCWIDVVDAVEGNDTSILDQKGDDVIAADFRALMASSSTNAPVVAAFCWGVMIGSDGLLKLQLQGLPAAAALLSGRQLFKV
jgi:hypothetical protein